MHVIPPRLALLALAASTSALAAVEIADADTKVIIGLYQQARIDVAQARDLNGDRYSINDGTSVTPDTADFYIRRFRPSLKGSVKGAIFSTTLQADNWGKDVSGKDAAGNNTSTTSVGLYEAFAGKEFQVGGIKHTVTLGKQLAWFNTAGSRSTTMQFVTSRASCTLLSPIGIGAGYRLASELVNLGVDIQNNTGDSTGSNTQDDGEGLCYTARIEFTGPKGDWNIGKWQESYAGAAGHGLALGLEAGTNRGDRSGSGTGASPYAGETTTAYGADLLLHVDGLTAFGEYRVQRKAKTYDGNTESTTTPARIWSAQAGYAMNLEGGLALEPALRYTSIDMNRDDANEATVYGTAEYGASGQQVDVGLTLFLAGHNHKLSGIFTSWNGEANTAGDQGTARIVRIQHQILF